MLKKLLAMLLAYARLCQLSREWLGATILRCMYREYVIVTKDMNVQCTNSIMCLHICMHNGFFTIMNTKEGAPSNFVFQAC